MHTQTELRTHNERPEAQTLFTVGQFANIETAFSCAALRNLIFKAAARHSTSGVIAGNGLLECGALVRCGRKILIHRERFLGWVERAA